MKPGDEEDTLLRSVTLQNATSILLARQRAEQELIRAKEALERRTAELAHSLARMRATLESTTDGLLVTDDRGRVTDFNQRYVDMWPIPREIVEVMEHSRLQETCRSLVKRPSEFVARIEEIYRSAPPESFDLLELADGRVFERFSRTQFVDGQNAGRVWSFRDITQRRRAEEARFRLAAIVQSSDDAIISKTLEGILTTWNRGAERMFGYTAEEVVGQPVTILIPPQHTDEETMILNRLKRGERIEQYETIRMRKDGTLINVALTVSPVHDDTGKIIGASKIARDITHRKRTEEALRVETRILELLNKTGTSIAATLDLQTLVRTVTEAAAQLSGARLSAFFDQARQGQSDAGIPHAIVGPARAALERFGPLRAAPLFRSTLRGSEPVRCDDAQKDERCRMLAMLSTHSEEQLVLRSYLAVPIVSRSGESVGALYLGDTEPGKFTERTQRIIVGVAAQAAVAIDNARLYDDVKRAAIEREHLLEAERAARSEAERVSLMKDDFLATLSHELRTPLSAILGWSQLLLAGGYEADELEQGLEAIARNARAQTQLIEDLLDMSRIVSGKVRLDVQTTDLAGVIDAAVESVRPSAEAKAIRLRKILDPCAGPVSGDPNRLQQIVWNLLSNAVKFTPKAGKVEVLLEQVNSHVEVTVRDSGQGISADFLPHVFERFRQADASTTRKHGGLGLGLSIVKQLVELHGGTIRVTSAGEDQGATFVVSLPLAPVRLGERRDHPRTIKTPYFDCEDLDLAGIRVLVVDDEPDARELLKRILRQCKADVIVAASADEGLRPLRLHKPHVLVSDIGMPDKDGYQFVRDVRRLPNAAEKSTPAIALTAFARSEDRTRAMMAGYQMHISKPIEPQELIATIASLAGRMAGSD